MLALVAMGQKSLSAIPDILRVSVVGPVDVEPTASQMVMIQEGQPYTVPAGKTFVATGAWTDGVDADGTH